MWAFVLFDYFKRWSIYSWKPPELTMSNLIENDIQKKNASNVKIRYKFCLSSIYSKVTHKDDYFIKKNANIRKYKILEYGTC